MCMGNAQDWAAVPFHFWSVVFFALGSIVGSLLNVCIHRMPRGESIVWPPSHCPHCHYAIPWYLNVPLVTWVYLRGKCAQCGAAISVRYFLVELLTGGVFLSCWLMYGERSALLALAYCLLLSGFIVATFIDLEHLIIPDEITLGGTVVGFLCSAAVPALHAVSAPAPALKRSLIGIAVGAGLIYGILRMAKFFFGRYKLFLEPDTKVYFTETGLQLPAEEIPYEEMFYRKSDVIALDAKTVELVDRCYASVRVRLSPSVLRIGDDHFNPEEILHLEAVTDQISVPREAMGLADVKFMAAIGAFLGWQSVIFTFMLSCVLGSIIGLTMIALKKQAQSKPIPYGPYIAMAATVWIFGGNKLFDWYVRWWLGFT
jgi:leader peptidase (prepilin peptidase)/N-methyltransferase